MQIGRWGNSLAVRLPKALVERLGLREGDRIDLSPLESAGEEAAAGRRGKAIEEIKARAWIPNGFEFDREELYDELMQDRLPKHWR